MRRIWVLLVFFYVLDLFGQAKSPCYQKAYDEIVAMLEGKTEISVKRAVFLAEYAYFDGKVDYQVDFCNEINRISSYVKRFINANHLLYYKTGKNIALNEFFFKPWSGNNYSPYICDTQLDSDDDYGQITLKRYPNHSVRAYSDTYNFDMKPWVNPINWGRNVQTAIGKRVAGQECNTRLIYMGLSV